jgi:coenzyme F420-0:L-glutamate ligase / coenzyme F420-1:gamma-L-glutamate ligase
LALHAKDAGSPCRPPQFALRCSAPRRGACGAAWLAQNAYAMGALHLVALPGIPEVKAGDSLSEVLSSALARADITLQNGDVLVLAQKIVSKAEGRRRRLSDVLPSLRAISHALKAGKDARLVELILEESRSVLRVKPGVIIVEDKRGFIMANAGIDQSNVPGGEEEVLLLPENPDGSARVLRDALREKFGVDFAVLIIDSFGRAWRNGVTGTAIGVAGLPALVDMRGQTDREGRVLKVTQVASADELAAAAVRGFPYPLRESSVQELIRPREEDLFR